MLAFNWPSAHALSVDPNGNDGNANLLYGRQVQVRSGANARGFYLKPYFRRPCSMCSDRNLTAVMLVQLACSHENKKSRDVSTGQGLERSSPWSEGGGAAA